jgi:type VI secretion system protein ImpG
MNLGNGLEWRLISHLASNYLSLAPGELRGTSGRSGAEALRSMLTLYNLGDDAVLARQLEGIVGVTCAPAGVRVVRPKGQPGPPVVLGGYSVSLDFSDEAFRTSGHFVLASVLERFFGLSAAVNSFVQVTARTDGGRRFQWIPRAGEQLLR